MLRLFNFVLTFLILSNVSNANTIDEIAKASAENKLKSICTSDPTDEHNLKCINQNGAFHIFTSSNSKGNRYKIKIVPVINNPKEPFPWMLSQAQGVFTYDNNSLGYGFAEDVVSTISKKMNFVCQKEETVISIFFGPEDRRICRDTNGKKMGKIAIRTHSRRYFSPSQLMFQDWFSYVKSISIHLKGY